MRKIGINPPLEQERLLRTLTYEPETGLLRWKIRPSNRVHIGDVAGYYRKREDRRLLQFDGLKYYSSPIIWCMMTGHWPAYPDEEVDHKETYGPKYDWGDRWDNLRLSPRNRNRANRSIMRHNTSGYPGVSWNSRQEKWVVKIGRDKKTFHLGTFKSFDAAVAVRKAAEKKFFGEYRPAHTT
jgi:AP2 domain